MEHTHSTIVVWDPSNKYLEGSIVDSATAPGLKARGVATLPIISKLLTLTGIGGYAKRSWGAGWAPDNMFPKLICPISLYGVADLRVINWKARLIPSSAYLSTAKANGILPSGQLMIAADSAQGAGFRGTVTQALNESPVSSRSLGLLDEFGGWTVGGKATLSNIGSGFYNFALYGSMPAVRIQWVAISLTEI